MSTVLITGANGWIGRALGVALVARGHRVLGLTRQERSVPEGVQEWVHPLPDFAELAGSWGPDRNVDIVMHLAARVHVRHEDVTADGAATADTEAAYHATNVEATLQLAQLAIERGVKRFVFLSSIKAVGEADKGQPWREDDTPSPQDAYGRSKRAAEERLQGLSDIEIVVLRPPLVYGPGVRANFARMLGIVSRGWPLPLGCAKAERSLIFLDNLVDALVCCAEHPQAAGGLFHVADEELLTVHDLLTRLGVLLNRPARLVPVPLPLLRVVARALGRQAELSRLTDSLRVDTRRIRETLGWRAPVSSQEALSRTVEWYSSQC